MVKYFKQTNGDMSQVFMISHFNNVGSIDIYTLHNGRVLFSNNVVDHTPPSNNILFMIGNNKVLKGENLRPINENEFLEAEAQYKALELIKSIGHQS